MPARGSPAPKGDSMKRLTTLMFCMLLGAAPAWAALSQKYADWPKGPVSYIMTAQEKAAYAKLTTDEEAQHFIDLFWVKRDPNLATRVNEFKKDFEARVAAADKLFGEGDVPGSMTDRGRVFILLGPPAQRGKQRIADFLTGLYGRGRGFGSHAAPEFNPAPIRGESENATMYGISFNRYKGVADIWLYAREQMPSEITLPKRLKSVMVAFFDTEGTGHFVLQRKIRDAKWAQAALDLIPKKDLVHPELTEIPVFPLLPGTTAATPDQLAWLSLDPAPWSEGATAGATVGVTTPSIFPAWVAVTLPPKVQAADLAVGRLTGPDGKVLGTFQTTIPPLATNDGNLYELSVPAPTGTSTLELALAAGGTPLAVRKIPITMEAVAPGATFITPMVAGAQVIDLSQFTAGTPFIYGGHHVVPRFDGHYDYKDNLSYFCLIVNPGMKDGKPNVRLRLKLYYEKQQISNQPYRSIHPSKVEDGVYMFGSQLPLSILPKGGTYTLKTTVKDFVSGVSRVSEIPIIMPEKK